LVFIFIFANVNKTNDMKVRIKNPVFTPKEIPPLFKFLSSFCANPIWEHYGLRVEIDPTIDFKGNDALIRWTDIDEGFNDKLIVNSLEEFQSNFRLINA
jgi:hypothetical protein